MFSKLARPKARSQTLMFSKNAVVCRRDGNNCLLFRYVIISLDLLSKNRITFLKKVCDSQRNHNFNNSLSFFLFLSFPFFSGIEGDIFGIHGWQFVTSHFSIQNNKCKFLFIDPNIVFQIKVIYSNVLRITLIKKKDVEYNIYFDSDLFLFSVNLSGNSQRLFCSQKTGVNLWNILIKDFWYKKNNLYV